MCSDCENSTVLVRSFLVTDANSSFHGNPFLLCCAENLRMKDSVWCVLGALKSPLPGRVGGRSPSCFLFAKFLSIKILKSTSPHPTPQVSAHPALPRHCLWTPEPGYFFLIISLNSPQCYQSSFQPIWVCQVSKGMSCPACSVPAPQTAPAAGRHRL